MGVREFSSEGVDGPGDEGVGGERGAVLCVEVGDLEGGYVAFGGEEVFVVGLGVLVSFFIYILSVEGRGRGFTERMASAAPAPAGIVTLTP